VRGSELVQGSCVLNAVSCFRVPHVEDQSDYNQHVQLLRKIFLSVTSMPTGSERKKHLLCMSLYEMLLSTHVRRAVRYAGC
jgi:hypothetical protein